jgi:hypothetical protein
MKKIIPLLSSIAIIFIFSGCVKNMVDLNNLPGTTNPTAVGTPLGSLISKTIGKDGGSIVSEDGNAELIFPSGALDENTEISIQAITNNAPNGNGNAYRFLPEGIKFLQPVSVKFHYTKEDLASTLSDLMGIAFQDSLGIWYSAKNFTNDSANKIISAPITHFSDWTNFSLMKITPFSTSVKVNKSVELSINLVEETEEEDPFAPAALNSKTKEVKWYANGILNGNSSVGTISGGGGVVNFKAPAKVPSANPVEVSVVLPIQTKFDGKTFNNLTVNSYVTIVDGERYLLEMRISETTDPFVYTDSVNMIVVINNDNEVIVSDINNFAPNITPPYATIPPCTATWEWDAVGETNVTGATGTISGSSGDPSRFLYITLTHTGAVAPKFTQHCEGGDPETEGGFSISGLPMNGYFTLVPGQTVYEVDIGDEYDKLTLLK